MSNFKKPSTEYLNKKLNNFLTAVQVYLDVSGFSNCEKLKVEGVHEIVALVEDKSSRKIVIGISVELFENDNNEVFFFILIKVYFYAWILQAAPVCVYLPENTPAFIRFNSRNPKENNHYWKHPVNSVFDFVLVRIMQCLKQALDECVDAIISNKPAEAKYCNSCSLQLFCATTNQFANIT